MVSLVLALSVANGQASSKDSEQEAVIARLLSEPAPPPDWRELLKKRKATPQTKPASDAPAADLVNYWRAAPETDTPDDATRDRLLEACEAKPEEIVALLPWLALDSPAVQERLKKLYDRLVAGRRSDDTWRVEALQRALMTHGNYFREELIRRTFYPDNVTESEFREALAAFVRLDREGARQVFLKESTNRDLRQRVTAISHLREFFLSESEPEIANGWLNELKQIAADGKAEREVRKRALLSIMKTQTPENDRWFLDLFRDPTLQQIERYSGSTTLLADVAETSPDYWIPRVAALVADKNPTVHANAVFALLRFQHEKARADALRPLLPWLENPRWAPDSEDLKGRLRLVQSLDRVELPESVPGLLKVAETATGYELEGAAEALAHYHARPAVNLLKRALKREKDDHHRRALTRAIIQLQGLTKTEMLEALKAYALQVSTEDGRKALQDALDLLPKNALDSRVSVGRELVRMELSDDSLSTAVLNEAKRLAGSNAIAADILREFTVQWQTPSATKAIEERLRSGELTVGWVSELIRQRKRLIEPLGKLRDLAGAALGIQAGLTGDAGLVDRVLDNPDRISHLALLAVARLARVDLPVRRIADWLDSADQQLARAADLYLEANDSTEARVQLWRRAAGSARILGARTNFDPGHNTFGPLTETEAKLRDAVLGRNGPAAIYALLSEGYWGGNGQRVLFVENGKTILRGEDGNGRTRECPIPEAEIRSLTEWLERERIDDLPPFDTGTADGIQYEFFRLTRDGGRRIFMNNPPFGAGAPRLELGVSETDPDPAIYGELTRRLKNLTERPMPVVYRALTELPGYQVVHQEENGEVGALRKEKGQLLAGVRLPSTDETAWHRVTESGLSADFTVEKSREKSPDDYHDEKTVEIKEGPFSGQKLQPIWLDEKREDGLWLLGKNGRAELIAKGNFDRPVVCPGGEWIVVARTPPKETWGVPNGVFRIHLADKRVIPVNLPPADNFDPLVWIDAHQRVLLYRQQDDRRYLELFDKPDPNAVPEKAEYYLVDPISGQQERVEGDFRPLLRLEGHVLQPTGKPNEFWAVVTEKEDDSTTTAVLGRYDTREFRFTETLRFPGTWFHSWDCFVDEEKHTVWVAVNGDLMRVSLPETPATNK